MKRFSRLFFSVFITVGLVASGSLYDVYAETPDYPLEFSAVMKTEAELVEPAFVEQPVVNTMVRINTVPSTETVGPDMSNHLEIPGIGVYRAVQIVGLNAIGEIDVPATNVGLWDGGAMPGQNGVVFLDGHVFGVFSNLRSLPIGSQFSLTWGGVVYQYRVADNQTYSLDYLSQTTNGVWADILKKPVSGTRGLNVMTCAGQPQGNTYSHRTVVYAYQI